MLRSTQGVKLSSIGSTSIQALWSEASVYKFESRMRLVGQAYIRLQADFVPNRILPTYDEDNYRGLSRRNLLYLNIKTRITINYIVLRHWTKPYSSHQLARMLFVLAVGDKNTTARCTTDPIFDDSR